ncbi:MAG TPA: hypothetical protein VD969_04420 [Symbiobacteriaceae bacterium]|nr:hypothetical protein [Symbiobacteriaceae bacterium]
MEGIRFFTLADEPGEDTERKLYELKALTLPANPSFGGGLWPFDQWRHWVLETPRAVPDCFILAARRHGAPYMRTDNDSQNGPILAVNRKMGYMPLPGDYVVIKRLS